MIRRDASEIYYAVPSVLARDLLPLTSLFLAFASILPVRKWSWTARTMVRPKSNDKSDDWYIVEDRKQRKRIQDRLAQRARRKRLAELKSSRSGRDGGDVENTNLLTPSTSADGDASLIREMSLVSNSPVASLVPMPPTKGSPVEVELSMNVWTALYMNGSMMGLTCSTVYPAKSRPVDPSIPSTLQPTALQLITIHPPWIDRFPFPKMRDNLINAISLVEEEDFLRDLFCMSSFEIKPGGAPWDPNAWIIGEAFREKWGFLFMEQFL